MGLIEDVENAYRQVDEGYEKGGSLELGEVRLTKTLNVIGIGGSAIAGELLRAYLWSALDVRVERGPEVAVNPENLTFVVSYSGNTWETIVALKNIVENGAGNVVIFTSNGFLEKYGDEMGFPVLKLTQGRQPRADLYEQFFAMLRILERLGLELDINLKGVVETFDGWRTRRGFISDLAQKLIGRSVAVYGYKWMAAAALRWKQQLNENSKLLAWAEALPEAFHNSLVGWGEHKFVDEYTVVLLRDLEGEPKAVKEEIKWFLGFLKERGFEAIEVEANGKDRLSRILGVCYLGDLVSIDLALMRGIDPEEVRAISTLKKHMSEWGVEDLYRP